MDHTVESRTALAAPDDRTGEVRHVRRVAAVLGAVVCSLAVVSAVHLAGHVQGRNGLFDSSAAGVAEAVIGAVLAATTITIVRNPSRARSVGAAGTGIAIFGFLIGLTMTARGGHWPDIAYHLTVLPVLIGSTIALVRGARPGRPVP